MYKNILEHKGAHSLRNELIRNRAYVPGALCVPETEFAKIFA